MPLRWLILTHRYLGIALSLFFVIWFVSGITMIYTRDMPRLTPQLRLERLPALDRSQVRLSASEAAERAGLGQRPGSVTLLTIMARPAYRFTDRDNLAIFADSGERVHEAGPDEARMIAAEFIGSPRERLQEAGVFTRPDQWTLQLRGQLPLYKFRAADRFGTELYVSAKTAEVSMLTTRKSRALAWIGAIPHWLYFAPLRVNGTLWSRVVIWVAALGSVLASIGLILGVTQSSVPYAGWLRWHYISGVVFGLFTLTWVFSGLMSMEPWDWTRRQGLHVNEDALNGGPLDLAEFATIDRASWDSLSHDRQIKEIEYLRLQGEPYYTVRRTRGPGAFGGVDGIASDRLIVNARTLAIRHDPFAVGSLVERLRAAFPRTPIMETTSLTAYDSYYYSQSRDVPLPVLRVKFDDPDKTWIYIDPASSQIVASVHRFSRLERWLFNGLHSLDFGFWYSRRPLWDLGMIVLSLGGLTSSGIGVWIGMKRLRAVARRASALRSSW
jgi:hypothetical protein